MGDNNRKCIAVIVSKPERKYQEGLLRGICNSAFSRDTNVAVFATSIMEGIEEHLHGELEIFELIQYEKFAGIVYAIGSFYGNPIIEKLNDKLKEVARKGIPVITVDGKLEGIPSYYNDDSNAIIDIVDHLVGEHNVKDIAYMTGHKGHPHAENSLNTYRLTMKRLGLSVSEDRIYYGDYWYTEGENFVNQLLNSKNGLPEAIICANEYMAVGVYKALHSKGIYTPKHILLACTSNDASTAPYLLTGENNLENVGYEACEKIMRVLDGEEIGNETKYFPCKNNLITSVGCGCQKASAYDYSKERGVLIDIDPGYFGELNFSREGLLFEKDFSDLFRSLEANFKFIKGFKELYVCMCEGWNNPSLIIQDTRGNRYTDRIQITYYRKEHESGPEIYYGENNYFAREEMFPDLFSSNGEPSIFVFRSLHFLNRNYGYVVLNNGQSPTVYEYAFNFWLHDFANAIESVCRLQSVHYMFYTDIMTGLYNRNGYNTMISSIIDKAKRTNNQILIALADMNFLKHINDTYGHEEGDIAIKSGASLLASQTVDGSISEKNFRMGGDEFVKIAVGTFTDDAIDEFKKNLYSTVEEYSEKSGKPYKIQFSLGISVGRINDMEEMEAQLSKVDKKMYEEKVRMKGNR